METLIIIALIVGGLILFAIEVFLIPGISIAGIGSAVCILYAIYSAFTSLGSEAGFITLGVSLLGIIGVTWWFMRSKTVDRLSLKKTLDYRPSPFEGMDLKPGDKGMSVTRLHLDDVSVEVGITYQGQAADGFIDEKTPVEIVRINETTVYVKQA